MATLTEPVPAAFGLAEHKYPGMPLRNAGDRVAQSCLPLRRDQRLLDACRRGQRCRLGHPAYWRCNVCRIRFSASRRASSALE